GGVQHEPHLIGERRAATGAVGGKLALVELDQVLGLTSGAVEAVVKPLCAAVRKAGHHIADIETLRGGLDPRDDAPINMPRFRAVAGLSEAADRCRSCLSATHP